MNRTNRVAVVGAGPAGFFTVAALLKAAPGTEIDLFNRLPAPYGLVRDGVAPDHEPIKSVAKVFARLLARDEVRYFGNVEVGRDLGTGVLRGLYDQIVYAVGSRADRRLGIPGEDLDGSGAATQFVGWYNGCPDHRHARYDLGCRTAVVVGNGNVALDVARILLLDPARLAATDIACHALDALRESRVREVVVLGRRGPAQASFSTPELKEFGALAGVSAAADEGELALDPASRALVASDRVRERNLDVLRGYAAAEPEAGDRIARFRFLASPLEVVGEGGRVRGVRVERNVLEEDAGGALRPRGTGAIETIECGLVLRSVGYRGEPVAGVPFDERRGIVPNAKGRVLGPEGRPLPGEYVSGWAKRGPSGVIGTNKADAAETVAAMTADAEAGVACGGGEDAEGGGPAGRGQRDVADLLDALGIRWIDKEGWRRLDARETALGQAHGRPRVKFCTVDEMLEAATAPLRDGAAGSSAEPERGRR